MGRSTGTSTRQLLWQPPGRYAERPAGRSVTFLELFFDLVVVVVLAQLAHRLAEHPTWTGVGWFTFLFFAVWSSWINGTLYHDLHPTNDISVRVFTFAQMLAVAVLAVYVGDVPGDGSVGFAAAYAANTVVLVVLWFRTGLHDPAHRPASIPYSVAYVISAALFVTSIGLEERYRYWLWAAALTTEVAGLVVAFRRWSPPGSHQPDDPTIAATPSLVERLGLFVIIVLGEVVVGAVSGMADVRDVGAGALVPGVVGVVVAIGLWWLYFDLVSHRLPAPRWTQLWLYLHLPLVMAIAAGGAGVLNTVEHSAEPLPAAVRWLLVGSLAVAMITIMALTVVVAVRTEHSGAYRRVDIALVAAAALVVAVGLTDFGATASLVVAAVLLLAPVTAGLGVWLGSTGPGHHSSDAAVSTTGAPAGSARPTTAAR
jgi:low temperature requirement protein LtrA